MAGYSERSGAVRVTVRLPGGGRKTSTFDTRREAEDWAASIERKAATGALSDATVGELFEEYLDNIASKTDSAKWNRYRILRWLRAPLASRRLREVTTHDIVLWSNARCQEVSSATVNRELNLMSAAFTYAVKVRGWSSSNPCHEAHRPEKGRPRGRELLTPDQIRAIVAAGGYDTDLELSTKTARVVASWLLSLETGMRSGEVLRIRPRDYMRDKRTVRVAAVDVGGRKSARSGRVNGDPSRLVPLTAEAMNLLDRLLASMPGGQVVAVGFSSPPYLVGINDQQRDALWRKVRDRSGVEDLTYHDSKHEACTRLSKFLDVIDLSHAVGTKDLRLLRDTYYKTDASASAALLPHSLTGVPKR